MNFKNIKERLQNNKTNRLEFYNKGIKISKVFSDVYIDVLKTLVFLKQKGLKTGDHVCIISGNSYEWVLVDIACLLGGFVLIAVHTKDYERNLENIGWLYAIKLIVTDTTHKGNTGDAPVYLLFNLLSDIAAVEAAEDNINSFPENDIFTIVFTSGTTGEPKGLGLIGKSILHTIEVSSRKFQYLNDDKIIIFLPLSVFTSRLYLYGAFLLDFNVIITVPEMLLNALRIYSPTIIQAVPYFFENIYKSFSQQLSSSFLLFTLYRLYLVIRKILPAGIRKKLSKNIFRKLYDFFGGRMRIMITGTAPISVKVLNFFNSLEIGLYESYGLNETGVITLNSPSEYKTGSVGKPIDGFDIFIDDSGQVVVKSGFFWTKGYLNASNEINKQLFRADNSIETGDTGYLDKNGFLFLNGRMTEIITLSNGQKTHPVIIEKKLNDSTLIKQSIIIGNHLPCLTAITVKSDKSIPEKQIKQEIDKVNKDLPDYLKIKNLIIAEEGFSLENKQLSNNLKLNRKQIYKDYESRINRLYTL